MKTTRIILLFTAFSSLTGIAAFAAQTPAATNTVTRAQATVEPTQANNARGTVTFTQEKDGIKVTAEITGLTPGKHGFHIHEYGDCRAPDATSAGGHFNPDHVAHAGPDAKVHHEGDMGNLVADNAGDAKYEYLDKSLSFHNAHSILGRSVIIHEHADDLISQPVGNSGARVACGIIGVTRGN